MGNNVRQSFEVITLRFFCNNLRGNRRVPGTEAFFLVELFGSFTTLSTLMYESMPLLRDREYFPVLWNIGGSVILVFT